MMARPGPRTEDCGHRDALVRLTQAEAFVSVAGLVLTDTTDDANAGIAAALAVLGGIAASDAACCARLHRRARGQAHQEAAALVAQVSPGGDAMARDLQRLVDRKDDAHYGVHFVGIGEARKMVDWAKRLVAAARRAVEA